jgi:thioredoxin-like negative regulator of GroEL
MIPRSYTLGAFILIAGGALLLPAAARAQEVQWRSDYNAALKEAKEKGLPLVLDFGTPQCVYCKLLDQTTFKDAVVVKTMNEQFIPVKIDAEREANLARILQINNYPTVVLADAERRILGTMEGYKEAGPFQENLRRALAGVANPEWMVRDYQEAVKAFTAPEYARAITLLNGVLKDGKTRPVQEKARQLLTEIEKQAAGQLARARQMGDKGQTTEAIAALTELVRVYPGTQEASEAGRLLTDFVQNPQVREKQRTQRARELLAQAKEDYRTKQYVCCLDRCEILSTSFGDLSEGAEALQLAAEIKSNPEWMQTACDNLTERLSSMYLALAETWLRKGQPQQAMVCLERVVRTFPGSRQAEVAQIRLSQIQGQTTRAVDYQKQQ